MSTTPSADLAAVHVAPLHEYFARPSISPREQTHALLAPFAYTIEVRGDRCPYWTTGEHIVANNQCRCGKRFILLEEVSHVDAAQAR